MIRVSDKAGHEHWQVYASQSRTHGISQWERSCAEHKGLENISDTWHYGAVVVRTRVVRAAQISKKDHCETGIYHGWEAGCMDVVSSLVSTRGFDVDGGSRYSSRKEREGKKEPVIRIRILWNHSRTITSSKVQNNNNNIEHNDDAGSILSGTILKRTL